MSFAEIVLSDTQRPCPVQRQGPDLKAAMTLLGQDIEPHLRAAAFACARPVGLDEQQIDSVLVRLLRGSAPVAAPDGEAVLDWLNHARETVLPSDQPLVDAAVDVIRAGAVPDAATFGAYVRLRVTSMINAEHLRVWLEQHAALSGVPDHELRVAFQQARTDAHADTTLAPGSDWLASQQRWLCFDMPSDRATLYGQWSIEGALFRLGTRRPGILVTDERRVWRMRDGRGRQVGFCSVQTADVDGTLTVQNVRPEHQVVGTADLPHQRSYDHLVTTWSQSRHVLRLWRLLPSHTGHVPGIELFAPGGLDALAGRRNTLLGFT